MWVFCGGMQRSGSTLQFQITATLAETSGRGARQEFADPDALSRRLQQRSESPTLMVVKTHVFTPAIETELREGRALGVYIYRDIRDVIVSFLHKEGKAFEPTWVARRIDNNLTWFAQWTSQPQVMVSRYEDTVRNLPVEVARIGEHLAIPLTPETASEIAEKFSLDEQRKTIQQAIAQNQLDTFGNAQYDRHSLLHTNHIHSGDIGGWKEALTDSQIAFIEARAGRWLIENRYALHSS